MIESNEIWQLFNTWLELSSRASRQQTDFHLKYCKIELIHSKMTSGFLDDEFESISKTNHEKMSTKMEKVS